MPFKKIPANQDCTRQGMPKRRHGYGWKAADTDFDKKEGCSPKN